MPPQILLSRTVCCDAQRATELRICCNKTCRRQGALNLLEWAKELAPASLTVTRAGCLGVCGAGPNVVLLPRELRVSHCSTPSHLARLLELQLPESSGEVALLAAALDLRLQGNAALERGDAARAVVLYTQALALKPPRNTHQILANLSAARLRLGDPQRALDDALAAQAVGPPGWTRGAEREAEARAAMKKEQDNVTALQ